VTPDFTNADIPMATPLIGIFNLLSTKLNLVQLPTDLTVVKYLDQDPTVKIRSSGALTPEVKLCVPSPNPMADGYLSEI
jgi:hypothetical protein